MPQDLPGFYYDEEKNRYFPIKGPIPGSYRNNSSSSSSTTVQKSATKTNQASKARGGMRIKTAKLLQVRELCGNVITSRQGKFNFKGEYRKIQASQPMIWKYHGTERIGDGALEQIHVDIDMPDGPIGTDILLTGGLNGSLCLYEVGKVGHQFNNGIKCMPDRVWPLNIEKQTRFLELPGHLWRPYRASIQMLSNISCIKTSRKHSPCTTENISSMQHVLITTLGSETSGGSVYTLNLSEPLEYNSSVPIIQRRIHEITSFDCTVWNADCNSNGSQAVIGTNLGAALVNMETGTPSWICRCKSDILSLQLDHSGNIVLCGLRNGAILTVDARQKPEGFSSRLTRHRIPYPSRNTTWPSSRNGQNFSTQWFELKGNIYNSHTISMPSSISCLASLKLYDQYFLGSSMDGSIKLYDHRLMQRGAVQSYEGNVNSHTRIELGVDASDRFVMSGGEDCNLRLWSIKSGELLFEDKFMNSVPSVVCWPQTEGLQDARDGYKDYGQNHCRGAWLGSQEGLFYMHCS